MCSTSVCMGKLIIVYWRQPNPGGASDGEVESMRGEKGSGTADTEAPSTIDGKKTAVAELVQIPANHCCAQSESCGS